MAAPDLTEAEIFNATLKAAPHLTEREVFIACRKAKHERDAIPPWKVLDPNWDMRKSTSPSAPHVPLNDEARATLEAWIQSEYKKSVVEKCEFCNRKECRQYFCVHCKEGALCDKTFSKRDLPHYDHFRVRVSQKPNHGAYVSRIEDLSQMPVTKEIALYKISGDNVHYLRTRDNFITGPRMWCHGCQKYVSKALDKHLQRWNADYARVCSIECFLAYDLACRTNEAEAVQERDEER